MLFQPNDYDNIKFITYAYFGLALATAYLMDRVLAWRPAAAFLAVPILACLVGSGVLSLAYEWSLSYLFLSKNDVAFAEAFRAAVPPEARVLTASNHNHPVPTLTGRPIVMGYPGWLWTYGLDYLPVQADVAAMYRGGAGGEALFKKYGVQYVVVGPSEISQEYADKAYYEAVYPAVLKTGGWEVFKVGE